MERAAIFMTGGWSGPLEQACVVIGETPKRYRCKMVAQTRLPGRNRWKQAGDIVLIPKYAVKFTDQNLEE